MIIITGNNTSESLSYSGTDDATLYGLGGNDILTGGEHDDFLYGGTGDDTSYGGLGFDVLVGGDGADKLYGEAGNDTLNGGLGADMLMGGTGNDTVSYFDSLLGVTIDLAIGTATGGDATGDRLTSIENIMGSNSGADTLTGDLFANKLYGYGGNDNLFGEQGHDELYGGEGADKLYGADGNDTLFGGNGADTLNGGNENDVLYGGNQNDILKGGWGNDSLYGEEGNDHLYAGRGYDTLNGGNGNDRLHAEEYGNATLWGGAGADTFIFYAAGSSSNAGDRDVVADFKASEGDKINFSLLNGIDSLSDLTITKTSGGYIVQDNPAANGEDVYITVKTAVGLTSHDFIF